MSEFELHPRLAADTITLGDFPVCRALLMNEAQFPWVILVPKRAGITELYQLSTDDRHQAQEESLLVSQLMMNHFKGDKLNTGAIGNMVPQLHLHHIVRFTNDTVWPKPVWGNIVTAKPYSDPCDIKSTLQDLIKSHDKTFTPCD